MKNFITTEQLSTFLKAIASAYDEGYWDYAHLSFNEDGKAHLEFGNYGFGDTSEDSESICEFTDYSWVLEDERVPMPKEAVLSDAKRHLKPFLGEFKCLWCDEKIFAPKMVSFGIDKWRCPVCGGKHDSLEIAESINKYVADL